MLEENIRYYLHKYISTGINTIYKECSSTNVCTYKHLDQNKFLLQVLRQNRVNCMRYFRKLQKKFL